MARQRKLSTVQKTQRKTLGRKPPKMGGGWGKPSNEGWHWIYTVMLAGLFLGVLSLAIAGNRTFVGIKELSQLVIGCCVIGLLVPIPWYAHRIGITRTEGFLFNVLGIGPILCALVLWLNYFVRTDVQTERYEVLERLYTNESFAGRSVLLSLQDSAYNDWEEMRRFDPNPEEPEALMADTLILTVGTGLFGYDVLIDREIIGGFVKAD